MDCIAIEVVAVGGKLVGRTASDRFNLWSLGLTDLVDDGRNGASLKRARRTIEKVYGDDFKLVKSRSRAIALPSPAEVDALGGALALAA
jgi:hypothetical protein